MINWTSRHVALIALASAALVLGGCINSGEGDGVSSRNGSGGVGNGGGNGGGGSGTFTLSLTDAPIDDAEEVVLFITGVDLQREGDDDPVGFNFDPPIEVELLALQGSERQVLLDSRSVPPGQYEWIRLRLEPDGAEDTPPTEIFGTESFVQFRDGDTLNLAVRDEPEVGLRLADEFDVSSGEGTDFVLDVDLRRALVPMPEAGWENSYYELRPAMRMVERLSSGHIEGVVDPAIAGDPDCTPAVYVFEQGQEPRDVFDDEGPITSALVRDDGGEYRYEIGFLTMGEYDIALTCDADQDQPDEDNADVDFLEPVTVEVIADETIQQDLPDEP